jgi:hypothetical protein
MRDVSGVNGMAFDIIPVATRFRCIKMVAAAAIIYTVLWLLGFQKLFLNDAEGLATLLQIIGTLYSVVYAFATYVIWGQFTSVENEIRKESGALKDLLLFSDRLKEPIREPDGASHKDLCPYRCRNRMERSL